MSAWIVERNHIRFLIEAALQPERRFVPLEHVFHWWDGKQMAELRPDNATVIGQLLWDECRESVASRYSGDDWKNLPGPIGEGYVYFHNPASATFKPTPAQVFKACRCYEYQSCEYPGWESSSAHAFIDALLAKVMTEVDGYEEAPWGAPEMAFIEQ